MPKRIPDDGGDHACDEAQDRTQQHKLYVGNLDHRVTEYHVIKMFTPFGKIRHEEYMWHTHGPKRGDPRGFAFVEYTRREDAEKAKESMNGKIAFGRPLVVRFVDEKVVTHNAEAPSLTSVIGGIPLVPGSSTINCCRSAKIAAIQNKLKLIDKESQVQDPETSRKKMKTSELRVPRTSSPCEKLHP